MKKLKPTQYIIILLVIVYNSNKLAYIVDDDQQLHVALSLQLNSIAPLRYPRSIFDTTNPLVVVVPWMQPRDGRLEIWYTAFCDPTAPTSSLFPTP